MKHWFLSLKNGTETVKAFKGETDLKKGLQNILLSHFVLAALMLVLVFSAVLNNGQEALVYLFWPVGFLVIGAVSWLTKSYLYHSFASLVGGRGDYKEYAGLISFPMAGAIVIGSILIVVFLFSVFEWTVLYLLLVLIPLISIIQITEKEYGISKGKAVTVVILPTTMMVVISMLLSWYGLTLPL